MKLPILELQKAVVQRLNRNITCEVYDNMTEDAEFPFVRLGETTTIDDGTKTDDRTNNTYSLHVFSRNPSQVECKSILNEVTEQITKEPLTLNGFTINASKIEMIRIFEEHEETRRGKKTPIWHGVIIFRFKIKEEN